MISFVWLDKKMRKENKKNEKKMKMIFYCQSIQKSTKKKTKFC